MPERGSVSSVTPPLQLCLYISPCVHFADATYKNYGAMCGTREDDPIQSRLCESRTNRGGKSKLGSARRSHYRCPKHSLSVAEQDILEQLLEQIFLASHQH